MHTEQAFDALERIINAAAHEQFSDALIQNAREALKTLRAECDLLDKRSVAQLEITRAAVAIVLAPPFQIYDSAAGQSGYRISRAEFEDLQRAVVEYQRLNEIENARLMVQAARTEQSK